MAGKIIVQMPRSVKRRLQKSLRKTKDAALRRRTETVLLYEQGYGCDTVAAIVGCTPSTAIRTARRFVAEGEDGLIDRRIDNGQLKVDDDLLAAMVELLRVSPEHLGWQRPTWTRELLAKALFAWTQVEVSESTVGRMLEILGARWGMPRPVVMCPWTKHRRSRTVNRIKRLVENLPANEVVVYEDEVDIHLNPKIGRDWMLPGTQKLVVTPGQNQKRYIAGALNPKTGEIVWVVGEKKNADLFVRLVQKVMATYPKAKRVHFILDNYRVHSCRKVQVTLSAFDCRAEFHFLPPYCPNDNKIERLWRDLHGNVTRNHRCKTIEYLMRNVERYLAAAPPWPKSLDVPKRRAA